MQFQAKLLFGYFKAIEKGDIFNPLVIYGE